MKWLDSIKRAYLDSPYQNKLILSMFAIIMLPVILLTTFSHYQNIQMIKRQSVSLSELYLQQAETSINSKITDQCRPESVQEQECHGNPGEGSAFRSHCRADR